MIDPEWLKIGAEVFGTAITSAVAVGGAILRVGRNLGRLEAEVEKLRTENRRQSLMLQWQTDEQARAATESGRPPSNPPPRLVSPSMTQDEIWKRIVEEAKEK